MVQKDDWRLLNKNIENFNDKELNPTDGEEIVKNAPYLKMCVFCWERVQDCPHQLWFIPEEQTCCICEECYNDFKDLFRWKELDGWDIDWS